MGVDQLSRTTLYSLVAISCFRTSLDVDQLSRTTLLDTLHTYWFVTEALCAPVVRVHEYKPAWCCAAAGCTWGRSSTETTSRLTAAENTSCILAAYFKSYMKREFIHKAVTIEQFKILNVFTTSLLIISLHAQHLVIFLPNLSLIMDLIESFAMECNDTCPIYALLTVQIIISTMNWINSSKFLPAYTRAWKHCNNINRLFNVGLQLKINYTYDQFCKFGFIFTLILKNLLFSLIFLIQKKSPSLLKHFYKLMVLL